MQRERAQKVGERSRKLGREKVEDKKKFRNLWFLRDKGNLVGAISSKRGKKKIQRGIGGEGNSGKRKKPHDERRGEQCYFGQEPLRESSRRTESGKKFRYVMGCSGQPREWKRRTARRLKMKGGEERCA